MQGRIACLLHVFVGCGNVPHSTHASQAKRRVGHMVTALWNIHPAAVYKEGLQGPRRPLR